MGIFESIKNAFGKNEPAADVTMAPSKLLSEAGIDPSGLKFGFGAGSITVSGKIGAESERNKILDVLGGIKGIVTVQDNLVVAAPPPAPPAQQAPQPSATPPAEAAASAGGARTYTVASGDTLWRIAERMYGNGSHYMKIFEANTGLLKDPDHIFPGQKLVIPEL